MTTQLTLADWTKRAGQQVSRTQLFIDGKFVDAASGKTFESINPRDGSVIAHIAEGDVEDVNRAVAVPSERLMLASGARWRHSTARM